jgi:glyoxylase-like metal-dependent hydrolase (beta-lactamase superfamily II)
MPSLQTVLASYHARPSRRGLLGAALGGAAALALPRPGLAKAPPVGTQAPYFYRFRLGDAEATIVSDGPLPLGKPSDSFKGLAPEEMNRQLRDNFLPLDNALLEQNVLVVNFGERLVVFDLGMGSLKLFGPGTGKLVANLRAAGIDPASVDALVMSHAHIDHCGGVMADDGSRNFPNAQLYIAQADFDYWTDDGKVPANYPVRDVFLNHAKKNLLPNRDRIHFFKDGQEFLPGVTALSAPGHTVGHTIFMISSGGQQLCYIGDLAHHPVLLLEKPRTQFLFDTDAVQSAESRVRMLDMLAANRIALVAYHFAWPGIGHVAKFGEGFHYYPRPMQMTL